jgi:hypothetical protein
VVPTVYSASRTIFTNQYAVTEQSHAIGELSPPGIFFKYDIEPILLSVEETRDSFLRFLVKVVNVFSGVLVAGHWGFTLMEWAKEQSGKRRRKSEGFLTGKSHEYED